MTSPGVFKVYPLPIGGNGIAASLDGRLWFTAFDGIGRLVP